MAYPQFVEGLAVVHIGDGCVIEGGARRELFTGRAARELFPRLLPSFDGTHEVAEIAADLGIPPPHVQQVADLMRQRRLLHLLPGRAEHSTGTGTDGPGAQDAGQPMWTFLRRRVPGGRAEAIRRRLQQATVRVAGTNRLADLVADLLRESGAGTVELPDRRPRPQAHDDDREVCLVISVEGPSAERGKPYELDTHRPRLPIRVEPGRIWIGPLFNVPGAPCAKCSAAAMESRRPDGATPRSAATVNNDGALLGIGAGVAVGAALRHVAGYGTPSVRQSAIEIAAPDGVPHERPVIRRGDCPDCGHPDVALNIAELAELDYERRAGASPRGWDLDPITSEGLGRRILAKLYKTQPRLSARRRPMNLHPEAATRIAAVSWMLARCVGSVRPQNDQPRWTPSVGRSGSTHAYVFGDVTGRGRELHYFDGTTHEFVVLPESPPVNGAVLGSSAGHSGQLSVVLTGDLGVLNVLGPGSRRVAYQDAGLALAQLSACAKAAGWRVRARPGHPSDLPAALDLNPHREIVAALTHLEPGAASGATHTSYAARRLSRLLRSPTTYEFADRPVGADMVRRLIDHGLREVKTIWQHADVDCVLYARRVDELPRGLYLPSPGSRPEPVADRKIDLRPLETHLLDRGISPAALLLFTGQLPTALRTHGPSGYAALVVQAAAAAGFVRLETAKAGLGCGLIARAPAEIVSACLAEPDERHRVFYGCAIGPAATQATQEGVAW